MTRVTTLVCSLTALLICAPAAATAQSAPSLNDLIRETQKQSDDPGRITIAWWLPDEFWRLSARQNGGGATAQVEEMVKVLQPYLVVAVVDGKVGPLGGVDFVDGPALRDAVSVRDSGNKVYKPLPDSELPGDVRNLVAILRSMFANMLGPMGAGIEVFFFPARTASGAAIAAPTKEGGFSVHLGTQAFSWRLPLASLMPQKVCPEDGEKMNGAWKFCPWHGKALVDAKP